LKLAKSRVFVNSDEVTGVPSHSRIPLPLVNARTGLKNERVAPSGKFTIAITSAIIRDTFSLDRGNSLVQGGGDH
jgi:hypothetical protein